MGIQGKGWLELDTDEWVRGCWPARSLSPYSGSGSTATVGSLILTNRRLLFVGRTSLDELAAVDFDEITTVQCPRQGLSRYTLIVETSSGSRLIFRTKKMACRQIEARSQMRLLTKR